MKKRFSRIISVILAVTIFAACLSIGAGAELQLESKSINVTTGIRINADGKEFVPVDSDGVPVEVFLYNGTTYLPVRGIGNLFGLGIEWDNETKSVYLGSRGGVELPKYSGVEAPAASPFAVESKSVTVFTGVSIYYNDEYFVPTGSDGEIVEVFLYNGTTYLPVRAISKLMDAEIDWDQAAKTVLLGTGPDESEAIVAAAAAAAKSYTDMGGVIIPYYQYYLKVSAVLTEYAQELKATYMQDPENIELEYMLTMFMAAFGAFDKEFGTYMEKILSFYEFGKTLTSRVDSYAKDGYSAEELETLAVNTEYLESNRTYYGEYITSSTPEAILKFVGENFSNAVIERVGNIEIV